MNLSRLSIGQVSSHGIPPWCYPSVRSVHPWINSAISNRHDAPVFWSGKEEYICLYFDTDESDLGRGDIEVTVDDYVVPVLTLTNLGRKGWQANLKVPPGLPVGEHEVRVRTAQGAFSGPFAIRLVDSPDSLVSAPAEVKFLDECEATMAAPVIDELENSMDETSVFRGFRKELLSCRFWTKDQEATLDEVRLEVGNRPTESLLLTRLRDGRLQMNARLPSGLEPGSHPVRVRTAKSPYSSPGQITYAPAIEDSDDRSSTFGKN